ncbi:MAG: histidine phosphatase family protein [Candidatus Izemoplasmatales bacterium]
MNICLIRHGETDWNAIGKLQGREDIPLNDNGKLQAEKCALSLKNGNWKAIYTSPLLRARQTADILARILGVHEVRENIDLIERDYGMASGLTVEERKKLFPDGVYKDIEDWYVLRDRVYGAILRSADELPSDDIIIVSHGSAINSILAELSNHAIGTGKTRLKNACMNMLKYKNQLLSIVFYNKSADELSYPL